MPNRWKRPPLRSAGDGLAQQTDVGAAEALAARVYDDWGAVNVLCNNAGVALNSNRSGTS
jgi:NADP-dependent 3-hydroxy acid dehydrogenase YdfG